MRQFLLDTHVFLWWLAGDSRLGQITMKLIRDPRNEVFVSSVSSWEIAIKKATGKLEAPNDIDTIVDEEGFSELPISIYHGEIAGGLPMHHKDPFDRMLIAQATVQGVQLITNDHLIQRYDVKILDPLT